MNLNKGCIEILEGKLANIGDDMMNLNKGCIEIYASTNYDFITMR